jgi:mannose-6-phosphate isomerase-like protein (cupin superfamily)
MDGENTARKAPRFEIFRGKDARDYAEHDVMSMDDITPAIAEGLAHYSGGPDDVQGQIVEMLYAAPGFSLTKVWFKSGYPLPLHSHSTNCLYYILAGSIKVGTEELGPGDGFFVASDVPYTYTPGPEGVEVLEFRDTDKLNIRFMSRTKTFWEKAGKKISDRREIWKEELPPSALVKREAAE